MHALHPPAALCLQLVAQQPLRARLMLFCHCSLVHIPAVSNLVAVYGFFACWELRRELRQRTREGVEGGQGGGRKGRTGGGGGGAPPRAN